MADISKITLPSGTTYDIKDAKARELINTLGSPTSYLGVTTTAITDGATTSPITIGDKSITPKAGDIVAYGSSEFVWSDTESKWREFGSTGSLKALAFKDSASAAYTPAGTISQPTFTGTKATISANYTPAGTVAISKGTGTANYTPQGTVSTPTITVTPNTASVKPFGSAGTLPSSEAVIQLALFIWYAGKMPVSPRRDAIKIGLHLKLTISSFSVPASPSLSRGTSMTSANHFRLPA